MDTKKEQSADFFDGDINQEMIDLVIARLRTMPSDASLSIGGGETISLKDVIQDVREQNELGLSVVREQIEYLRSLKDLLQEDIG